MTSIFYKTARNYRSFKDDKPTHVPQPFLNYAGLPKMMDDSYKYTPKDTDMVFTQSNINNSFNTLKRPTTAQPRYKSRDHFTQENLQKLQQRSFVNTKNPNSVEEAPTSFWMTHLNSSDIYRSFLKGTNPWARSSGFTQPLQNTRGALCYYQNVRDNRVMRGFPYVSQEQKNLQDLMMQKEREEKMRKEEIGIGGIRVLIVEKIINGCKKKGWIGLRNLKCYLRSISPHDCDIIDKNLFKLHLTKWGIILEFDEVSEIYQVYDFNKTDHINFIQFLNSIRNVSDFRGRQIEEFLEQVKERNENYVLFSKLLKIADMRFHPEAIKYVKKVTDLWKEYQNNWGPLKIDDVISESLFREFFYDVSTCVDSDSDFTQILKTLGYK